MNLGRCHRSLCTLSLAAALLAGSAFSVQAQQLTVQIAPNRQVVTRGDTLTVTVMRQNPVLAGMTVDFYAGVLLPDGRTLYLFTPTGIVSATTANLAGLPAFESAVSLSTAASVSRQLLSVPFIDTVPPSGSYLFFYLALTPNALADGLLSIH